MRRWPRKRLIGPILSRVLRDYLHFYVGPSVGPSVGRLVGPSVGPLSTFFTRSTFSAFFSFLSLLLLPKCSSDLLQHCSCPPAHDWGIRVSSLAFFNNLIILRTILSRSRRRRLQIWIWKSFLRLLCGKPPFDLF